MIKNRNFNTFFVIVIIFISCKFNAFSIGIYGCGTISPSITSKDFVLNAGCGVGIVIDSSWNFIVSIDNTIFNHLKADFIDTETNLVPNLVKNTLQFQAGKEISISNNISIIPYANVGINYIYYRIFYPAEQTNVNIFPDFGDAWYFSVAPIISVNYEVFDWLRLSTGITYKIPLNLKYEIKNSAGKSLINKDLSMLSLFFEFQLGDFK